MAYRASVPPVRVRFENEGGKVVEQTFTKPFTLGRAAACEVRFEVKSVSRLHARVVFEKGQWWVHDASSVNGLYLEGRKVQQVDLSRPVTLRLGPSGPTVHLSVAYPGPEVPRQEPAARARFEPEIPAKASPPPRFPSPPRSKPPAKAPPQPRFPSPPPPKPSAKAPPAPTSPVEVARPEPPVREVPGAREPIKASVQQPPAKAPPPPEPAAKAEPEEDAPEFPKPYRANRFNFSLGKDWTDETVYILGGPVTDGVQHNITIHVEPDVPTEALLDYADAQIQSLEAQLQQCRVLKRDQVELDMGLPAYRAIFTWYPAKDQRLYQEQLYVLHQQTGYTLTATFTTKTRKTLGPQVERIMLSFTPEE